MTRSGYRYIPIYNEIAYYIYLGSSGPRYNRTNQRQLTCLGSMRRKEGEHSNQVAFSEGTEDIYIIIIIGQEK